MKLHLPIFLRKSVLSCLALVASCTLSSGTLAFADDLVLGAEDTLSIDYAAADSFPDLENGTLQLDGDTLLQLLNCGSGDGKTYTLFTGVSGLVDAEGNPISLDSTNNAISNYFDITQPGSGFWADAILQLSTDGTLQLVRHNEVVKDAVTISSRQISGADYQYYEGVIFADIYNTSSLSYVDGGAIYGNGDITLSNNGSVEFSGNKASSGSSSAYGGAIYGHYNSTIELSINGSVVFEGNTASSGPSYAYGGAICGHGDISLSDNGSVVFEGNTASSGSSKAYGGAICVLGDSFSTNTLSNNGSVTFSGNTATSSYSSEGGAIYVCSFSTIMLSNNGSVTFSGNTATSSYSSEGGVIYGDWCSTITLSNNGSVTFSGNTASSSDAYGGAIYGASGASITLSDNGSVTFSGNTASASSDSSHVYADGGAIYSYGDLSIRNNDSVEFYQNAEVVNGNTYRLRSIYAYCGSRDEISLSAAAGKSITFRDSIYIGEGSSFKLNEAYEGKAQLGDIIFTGATTVDDLYTVKNNVAGTEAEIRLSRTTEVNALTELYGGRLRVEEGAIYQGRGITAMEGSAATVLVKDATLSLSGYDLTFNAGTTLALAGANSITGNLNLLEGSTLHIDFAGNEFTTNLNGSTLELTGDAFLRLTSAGKGDGKTYTLFTGVSGLVDAEGNAITLTSSNNAVSNYFDATQPGTGFWADGTLVLSDDGTLQLVLHDQDVKEAVVISTRQTGGAKYQYYAGVSFEDIQYNPTGGPALGGAVRESSLMLSDNGFVLFSGNKAEDDGGQFWRDGEDCDSDVVCGNGSGWVSAYTIGGAICVNNLTLNKNGSVEFIGNTATSDYVAHGGAVYGDTVTMSDNGSVKFIGNLATSSSDALGGAIDGGTITLNGNGSVEFIDNKALVASNGQSRGGAIHGDWGVTLNENGSVLFQNNKATYGGAIYAALGAINLNNNVNVSFIGNSGRAIYAASGAINLNNNGSVSFSGNAIYAAYGAINLNNNGSVSFSGGSGSAINTAYGAVNLNNNGSVSFSGNTGASGGAIYGAYDVSLNGNGSISFIGNSVSGEEYTSEWAQSQGYYGVYGYGGAIYGATGLVSLCDNGRVEFIGNNVSVSSSYPIYVYGGAICTFNDLNIRNNDSVEFYQNAEGRNGEYRLNSIVVGGYWSTVSLSAAEGKHITFRDSIYIDAGNTFNLNADYTNANGKTIKQQGDILFTGAHTEDDLYVVKGNVAGTTAEILSSRTSEVYTMTNLYGGRLRVEDGAIYQGYGITAHADSASTVRVKDAELRHSGYDLIFNAGTTLELEGTNSIYGNLQLLAGSTLRLQDATLDSSPFASTVNAGVTLEMAGVNTITGNLQMQDDSTLRFIYATDTTLSMTGNLNFDGSVTIELVGYGEGNYELISQNGGMLSGWDLDALRFMNGQGESLDASRFAWVASSLYFMNSDFQSIVWTNATGDGLWNNVSENWDADGTPYASSILQNVILGAGGNETITMVGNQAVNSLTVQQGGQYTLAGDTAGTKLRVTGDVLLGENASLSIQGNLESGALKGAGSLSVSGSLTLTDAAASSSIGGDVSVSGALKTAGVLTVGGALKAGSLAGGSNELAVSGNITLGSMTGDSNVLTSGGSASTGAINGSHNSITAVTLVTTNGKALTGDYNTLEATAGQVFVQGQLKGNYNTLKGGKAPADGNTISVWSGINGNNNVLLAEEGNVVTHAINGSHNSITAAALVTTNGKTLTGDYNTLESTAGQVYVQGVLTGSHNTLKACAAPSASDPNALCVWGGIVGDYNQLLTTGGNIAMTSSSNAKVQGNHNTLEATEGAILVRDILGAENTLTAGTYISTGAVGAAGAGSNGNTLTAGTYIQTSSLTGDANTLTAGTYVNINGKLTGGSNDISSSGTDSSTGNGIRIASGLEGDGNKLTAEAGRIVIGGGISLNGSNNTLLAKGSTSGGEGITLDGNLAGSGNKLTAETGNIKLGSITGDSNTLEAEAGTITASTINGTGNTLKGATVQVNGELKGSANTIEGNAVQVGTLSGSGHSITALAGNVSIGSLNDTAQNSISTGASYGITVGSGSASNQTWTAGSLSVTGAAGLSLTDSTVTVSGTVESAVLTLAGNTTLTAASVSAENISMSSGVSIVGDVNASDGIEMAGGSISGTLTAGNATVMNAVTLGTANVTSLQLQTGANLDVNGTLNAGTVTMQQLTTSAPALTVGQFAAGETVFQLSAETLNALKLEHGESVVIARAEETINRDFTASLTSSGSTMLDVAAYRYVVSVSGTDVVVTLDYANWGTRVWYGNTWEGMESWQDYMVCGYDAVDGVETVDLKGAEYAGSLLIVAPGDGVSSTVFRNGSLSFESGLIADGRVEIASTAALEVYDYLDAAGKEVSLVQGAMMLNNADIGSLTGTGGALTIYEAGEVCIGSNVTLGSLRNDGTLDIGRNKLDVAANVTNGGNVVAGEVVVHSKATIAAKFNALVADMVKVTNTLSSYAGAISLGDGSAVGELYADNLTVREGTVALGCADKATAQKLENLELQKNATLLLNSQTELSVSNSLTAAANSAVQLEQDAALKYQAVSISNRNEDKTVSVNAAQLAAGSAELVLQDAYVTHTGNKNRELAYALVNSTVENAGSGTLQLTNAGNELSGVVAGSGNVEIYNAASGMTLDELRLAAGLSLSAAVGDAGTTHTPAGNAEVSVSGTALLAGSSILNANLTLVEGATLDLVSLNAGAVTLNGTLTFGGKISMGENLLALLNEKLGWESSVTLFTGLERVDMSALTGNSDSGLVWAGDVFSNMGDNHCYYLNYVADVGSLVVLIVPEPTTATLSLLALAALAARRRRK